MKHLAIVLCLFLTGCQLPQWRVFQQKVPQPIVKPAQTLEVERQAADLLARRIESPPELIPVAVKLSESLGVPDRPLEGDTQELAPETVRALNRELAATKQQIADLNKLLAKNEGKKVEGTGINLFGYSFGLGVIALIALCVMFPPIATILWWVFQRVAGALTRTAKGVNDYIKANPDQGEKLKTYLSGAQDTVDKQLIKKIRAKL